MSESNGLTSPNGCAGYSAEVRLRLFVRDQELPVRQVAHDQIIMRDSAIPVECASASAGEMRMTIDGVERRWLVRLATPGSGARSVGGSRIISLLP